MVSARRTATTAAEPVTLPIVGDDARFHVRRIYCVGRNYLDHIREMKEADERDPPFFFQKPTDAIVQNGAVVPYPAATGDFQFEVELVAAIGRGGIRHFRRSPPNPTSSATPSASILRAATCSAMPQNAVCLGRWENHSIIQRRAGPFTGSRPPAPSVREQSACRSTGQFGRKAISAR